MRETIKYNNVRNEREGQFIGFPHSHSCLINFSIPLADLIIGVVENISYRKFPIRLTIDFSQGRKNAATKKLKQSAVFYVPSQKVALTISEKLVKANN